MATVRRLHALPALPTLVAVSRSAPHNAALQSLAVEHEPRLHRVVTDLGDPRQIDELGAQLAATATRIDLVIHCAGAIRDEKTTREKTLRQLDAAAMQRSFALNALAPALLLRALLRRLRRGDPALFASISAHRSGLHSHDRLSCRLQDAAS